MNTRKEFLLATSLLAAVPAAAGAAQQSEQKPAPLTFTFDEKRFSDILAKPAKHKQCFGAVKMDDVVFLGMNNTMNAYERYLGEPSGSVQTVAVLYHGPSIALAMNDRVWNDLLFPFLKNAPAHLKEEFAAAVPGKGNPSLDDVAGVVRRGASLFVCHNAIAGFAGMIAGSLKKPVAGVHEQILSGLLPGALAVPAGVMAINACQEAKFTYIQSSL